ncbi:2-succinyl-6-hydroxy-2,4-cyclohexadiene-1-carboxylate synthase [Marininema halotolerans]|uniref:Putative 2-succinyl-6-hydroxy-2,4-cyclohexadiene-1-carboxylate synthase n=1 Tax=Marininema halotolerans TaxID=1155944 RepID=A0A1I6PMA9_9BACL|nr:2-succinyl-6-hydroxy-2,4-cyclohexadiene-1-carboxylate synthase [Marininema halotolerans]SFS41324.1 2-succinyl-6-hydroxy-2,4-cyclohexadiene-1-carboxylate synthase [Marininema halotolerans]
MEMNIHGLRYRVQVKGRGTAILLLHGFTGSGDNWDSLVPYFTPHFRTIQVDLLGHGRTESPGDSKRYTVEHAVADLAAILDELGEERVHLLGYSMGGRLALSFAMINPDRVGRLILESSSPGLKTKEERNERIARDQALADQIETEGMAPFVERWENLPLFASQQRLPEKIREAIHNQRLENDPKGLANSLRGMGTGKQPSWWESLPQFNIPIMLLVGELDTKFQGIAREMMKWLPKGRMETIPGAGHTIHVEEPQHFGTIVMDFLQEEV